jgi:hypothetical protein
MNLMPWTGTSGAWTESDASLPRVDPRDELQLQRWCVIAGGLALVLSRAADTERRARLAATQRLYEVIRHGLERSASVAAGAMLISDVMHEIAETADGLTRRCLRACFEASLRSDPTDASAQGGGPVTLPPLGGGASSLLSQPRPSRLASEGGDRADVHINARLLAERASALRRSVAAARTQGSAR